MNPNQRIRLLMELRRHVTSTRVLSALENVPRDLFVSPHFADQAWDNSALPIDCGQTISQPLIVAKMTEVLDLGERSKVLEVGTGSGYQTAVLAKLCRRVYTLERHKSLLAGAEKRFKELRLTNVVAMHGDGTKGWPPQQPFDRILVTASAPEIPDALCQQLAIGGILVSPLDVHPDQQNVVRIRRVSEDDFEMENLFPVRFVPLIAGMPHEG